MIDEFALIKLVEDGENSGQNCVITCLIPVKVKGSKHELILINLTLRFLGKSVILF